jgi:hypothetical protein
MNDKKDGAVKGGVSAIDLLQIAFIILKLCHVINWSWWIVLMPTWICIGIAVICIILIVLITKDKKHL